MKLPPLPALGSCKRRDSLGRNKQIVYLVTGTILEDIKTATKIAGKLPRLESWAECKQALKAMRF